MFSADMQSVIERLKGQDEKDADVVKRALRLAEGMAVLKSAQGEKEKPYSLSELTKFSGVITKMSEGGFAHEKTIAVFKAVFIDSSDANLDAAFDMFDSDKSGSIDMAEMKAALPLMGESVPEDRIEELFKLSDQDKDGKVDKAEFRRLVRGLSAEDGPFALFRKSWDAQWKAVGQRIGDLFTAKKSVADAKPKEGEQATAETEKPKEEGPPPKTMHERMKESFTTTPQWAKELQENTNAYVLANKAGISWTMGPSEQTKIGKVITRMTEAEYSEASAISVVKVLFTNCSEEEIKAAFAVFSAEGSDSMSKESFTKAMPLMGEDVPADKVDEAFKAVDANGSGELDLSEFTSLIEMLNPRKAKKVQEAEKPEKEPEKAEATTGEQKPSTGATLMSKWGEFTSGFATKKDEAPAPPPEAPETKAEPADAGKASEPAKAEPENTPATVGAN